MGYVLTLAGGKGGAGATGAAAHIGVGLARLGHRVLLIDASWGLRHLDLVFGVESRIVATLADVLVGEAKLKHALIRDSTLGQLFLLPAPQTQPPLPVIARRLGELCRAVRSDYDFVLVDSPPGRDRGFRMAAAGGDALVLLTEPVTIAVAAARRAADEFRRVRPAAAVLLIINQVRTHLMERGDAPRLAEILHLLPYDLLGVVPHDGRFGLHDHPLKVVKYSPAAREFQALARRLAEDGAICRLLREGVVVPEPVLAEVAAAAQQPESEPPALACADCGMLLTAEELEWFAAMRRSSARCTCGADVPFSGPRTLVGR